MRASCRFAASVLDFIAPHVVAGVTTSELDRLCHDFIVDHGAYPAPLNYKGFPASVCTSVNEVACHGIPNQRKLADGDIINIDVTVFVGGVHGDTNATFLCGDVDETSRRLVEVTED
ncbi:MAG: M24 family metallopeptidase, partial [Myxococcales bacterium]|nr:M24 family metallopeptidase [Myxococcales bacterium]